MDTPRARAHIRSDKLGATILGYLYVYFWVKRANMRAVIQKGAIGILAAFLGILLLELGLEVFGLQLASNPSLVLQVLFAIAFSVALYNKVREWREKRQEYLYINAAMVITEILSGDPQRISAEPTTDRLLSVFLETFRFKHLVCATIALLEPDGKRLKIRHRYPRSTRGNDAIFELGEGAAGYCAESCCAVYIPRKSFGHAVVQIVETATSKVAYDIESGLYAARSDDYAYECVLSVPIVLFGRCYGVLSFDSAKPNTFRRLDMLVARHYGSVLAQVLQAHPNVASREVRIAS